jgi:hypothetical protein
MNSPKSLLTLAIATGLALTASLRAESGPCATVNAALDRVVAGPTHVFSKKMAPSNSESETIFLGGKVYVRVRGQWKLSPITSADMAAQEKQNRSRATQSCRIAGEESVGGSAATVYEASGRSEVGNDEAKFWIAKGSGQLLKDEETIRDGKEIVIQRSAHYEYTGVHAPI